MQKMVDTTEYVALLAEFLPQVIETEVEHERAMKVVLALMEKAQSRTSAETALLKLLVVVISDYERKLNLFPVDGATSLHRLKELMEVNRHTAKDLWQVVGDKGTVSRILNGKRGISKAVSKRLAGFYGVPASLFI